MKKKIKVTYESFTTAYDNWCAFHNLDGTGHTTDFFNFINCTDHFQWDDVRGDNIRISERPAQYIKALSGPHWYTLLKAHYARQVRDSD